MALEVYLDAGFKGGVSTNHWSVFTPKGERIKRRTFKSEEIDSNKAEMQTINSVIQWLLKKKKRGVTIYTDNMHNVKLLNNKTDDSSVSFLQWQMKGSNIKVEWVSREHKMIKIADYYCSELQETVFKRKEHTLQ